MLHDGAPTDTRLGRLRGLPALVLHGTADPMFPPAHGSALANAIPGARLIELADVGLCGGGGADAGERQR